MLFSVGEIPVKPRKPPKPKHKGGTSLKVSIGRKQLTDSKPSQYESAMTVQVPRSKLRGSLGHSRQHPSFNPEYSAVYGGAPLDMFGGEGLMFPPPYAKMGVHEPQHQSAHFEGVDQVVPVERPHKSKHDWTCQLCRLCIDTVDVNVNSVL